MTSEIDLEALNEFVRSPGWAWFSQYVTAHWGPSGLRYQQAVREAAQHAQAVTELQKVLAAQDAIHAVMSYPAEYLETRKRHAYDEFQRVHQPEMSRRGTGL